MVQQIEGSGERDEEDAMQALIVHDDPTEVQRLRMALARRGFMVAFCNSQEEALGFVRKCVTDLLILKQVIEGRHTTAVALAAERHHPRVSTILLSKRAREDALELFELIPSVTAILSSRPESNVLATLAISAVQNINQPMLVLAPHDRMPRVREIPSQTGAPSFASRRAAVA